MAKLVLMFRAAVRGNRPSAEHRRAAIVTDGVGNRQPAHMAVCRDIVIAVLEFLQLLTVPAPETRSARCSHDPRSRQSTRSDSAAQSRRYRKAVSRRYFRCDRTSGALPGARAQQLRQRVLNHRWCCQRNHFIVAHVWRAPLAKIVFSQTRFQRRHAAQLNSPVHHFRP